MSTQTNNAITVTASSTPIVIANKRRIYLALVNSGANDAALSFGATAGQASTVCTFAYRGWLESL